MGSVEEKGGEYTERRLLFQPPGLFVNSFAYIYTYIYVYSLYFILVIRALPFCGNPCFSYSFQSLPFAGTLLAASYDPGEQTGIKHQCAGVP